MSWLDRFTNVCRGRELHSEIDEELRFHLEARIADNIAAGILASHTDCFGHVFYLRQIIDSVK